MATPSRTPADGKDRTVDPGELDSVGASPSYGFPAAWWRGLEAHRPPGLGTGGRWRSPLRDPWLTSVFGLVLLVTLPMVTLTGLLSYIA